MPGLDPIEAAFSGLGATPAQDIYARAAQAAGLDPQVWGPYLARTHQLESSGSWTPADSSTGAKGPFQFLNSTWKEYGGGGNVLDPWDATLGAANLAKSNIESLRQALGREPTPSEVYLAHQQGAGGASKILLNPQSRVGDLVGDDAISVNAGNPNAPAGAFTDFWNTRYAGGSGPKLGAAQSNDPIERSLGGLVELQRLRDFAEGKAQSDPNAAGWGMWQQMLDSALMGHGLDALKAARLMQSGPDAPDLGFFHNEVDPAKVAAENLRLQQARAAWQKENPGKTVTADLTAGSIAPLGAIALTEGAALPAVAAAVPRLAPLVRFLTGSGGVASRVAEGTMQGSIAGAVEGKPGEGALIGAATGPAGYLAEQASNAARRMVSGLTHSPGGPAVAGLGAMYGLHEFGPELWHLVQSHPQLAAAVAGGASAHYVAQQLYNLALRDPQVALALRSAGRSLPAAAGVKLGVGEEVGSGSQKSE